MNSDSKPEDRAVMNIILEVRKHRADFRRRALDMMAERLGDDVPQRWSGPDYDELLARFDQALDAMHGRRLDHIRAFVDSERSDFPPPQVPAKRHRR
jgi:hypothetical protein